MTERKIHAMHKRFGTCGVMRKPVVGYEGYYEVDSDARVYGVERTVHVCDNGREYEKKIKAKELKQAINSCGYKVVALAKDGHAKNIYVHRIVAQAFIDNPLNLPVINHIDEDKLNNLPENLEWCDVRYNNTYGRKIEKWRQARKGYKCSEELKLKLSKAMKSYHAGLQHDDTIRGAWLWNGTRQLAISKCNGHMRDTKTGG